MRRDRREIERKKDEGDETAGNMNMNVNANVNMNINLKVNKKPNITVDVILNTLGQRHEHSQDMGTEMHIGTDKLIDTDTGMGMDMKRT